MQQSRFSETKLIALSRVSLLTNEIATPHPGFGLTKRLHGTFVEAKENPGGDSAKYFQRRGCALSTLFDNERALRSICAINPSKTVWQAARIMP